MFGVKMRGLQMFFEETLLTNGILVLNLWRISHTEGTESTESHSGRSIRRICFCDFRGFCVRYEKENITNKT